MTAVQAAKTEDAADSDPAIMEQAGSQVGCCSHFSNPLLPSRNVALCTITSCPVCTACSRYAAALYYTKIF